jgi:hypothetical protein
MVRVRCSGFANAKSRLTSLIEILLVGALGLIALAASETSPSSAALLVVAAASVDVAETADRSWSVLVVAALCHRREASDLGGSDARIESA